MVSTSDFESGSLGSIPSESVFVSMGGVDAYLRRLGLFVSARQPHAALLLTRDEHDELFSLTNQVLLEAQTHLAFQEIANASLLWFNKLSDAYNFSVVDFQQLTIQNETVLHIEARARYALVVLFYCIFQREEESQHTILSQMPSKRSESDSFTGLFAFLHTSTDDRRESYQDEIVTFLCDTLSWVCNVNITTDVADSLWIYSPDSCSSVLLVEEALTLPDMDRTTAKHIQNLCVAQYPSFYNSITYISRSVRGLYYLVLNVLSSMRYTDHLLHVSTIACRLLQLLSPTLIEECAIDDSNKVTFKTHPPTHSDHKGSRSRRLFKKHEVIIAKLIGFVTALGNVYAQALAGYYFVYAELHMMDAPMDEVRILDQLINDLCATIAIVIVQFSYAFSLRKDLQLTSEEMVDQLMSLSFHNPECKQKPLSLTLDHDILRYDVFFYIMVLFIFPVRSVCNYFCKEFRLHIYSFGALVETNKVLACIPSFLLSHFAIKQPSVGLVKSLKLQFYEAFLSAYELKYEEYHNVPLIESRSYLIVASTNASEETLQTKLLRFHIASPYSTEPYITTSGAPSSQFFFNPDLISPTYLAENLHNPMNILTIGEFFAQTLGMYSNSLYLAYFIQAARKLDSRTNGSINTISAWISIFRGFKLAREYIINTQALVVYELADMEAFKLPSMHESLILYNSVCPSTVFIKVFPYIPVLQMGDILARILGELLYYLGLASQIHEMGTDAADRQTPAQYKSVAANSLIQEVYVLLSSANEGDHWACSALVDGLLYTLEAFVPFSNKYSYTDHCLLLDLILRYTSGEQRSSVLSRLISLAAGALVIADFVAVTMTGSKPTASLISNYALSFKHTLVQLNSTSDMIDTGLWAQLLQDKQLLLQSAHTDEVPGDLLDVLYEELVDELIHDSESLEKIFDLRYTSRRLLQLPIFQEFPLEVVAYFLSDIRSLIVEEVHRRSYANGHYISCSIDVANPFKVHLYDINPLVSIKPMLTAFLKSQLDNRLTVSSGLLHSLDLFPCQSRERERIVTFGTTPCHPRYILNAIVTLAGMCSYMYNISPSLPSYTDMLQYLLQTSASIQSEYSGVCSAANFHQSLETYKDNAESKDRDSKNPFSSTNNWMETTIDLLAFHPRFIDKFITLRSAIMLAGREQARQSNNLLIELEIMLNLGICTEFKYDNTTRLACAEDSLVLSLVLNCIHIIRADFYEFNQSEKLHLLQFVRARSDFLPALRQISFCPGVPLENNDHDLWTKYAIENVLSTSNGTLADIPLAEKTCQNVLYAFINGPLFDLEISFLFSTHIDLYMAVLSLYSTYKVKIQCTEDVGNHTTPRKAVFLRTVYLICNFLYIQFGPPSKTAGSVLRNVIILQNQQSLRRQVPSVSPREEQIVANTFGLLLHILERSISTICTPNILDWTVFISSEALEFFTPLFFTIYELFQQLDQGNHGSVPIYLLKGKEQSRISSLDIMHSSIRSKLRLLTFNNLITMLSILTKPISGVIAGLRLPPHSLLLKGVRSKQANKMSDTCISANELHPNYTNSDEGSLVRLILGEIQGQYVSEQTKQETIRNSISSLALLSKRFIRDQTSKRMAEVSHSSLQRNQAASDAIVSNGSWILHFDVQDLLTLYAIQSFDANLLENLLQTSMFSLQNCEPGFLGFILCHRNCGNKLLEIILRTLVNDKLLESYVPMPLIYMAQLSEEKEVSMLAEQYLLLYSDSKNVRTFDAFAMTVYLNEADSLFLSVPQIEEDENLQDDSTDFCFVSWMFESFLQATTLLFNKVQLYDTQNKQSDFALPICQFLLQHIEKHSWKTCMMQLINATSSGTTVDVYNKLRKAPNNIKTAATMFSELSINAIQRLSQDLGNVTIILGRALQEKIPRTMWASLNYLTLLYNPSGYLQQIINVWILDTKWAVTLLIYLGAPVHELERSLPLETLFRNLFDFETIFKPWMRCPSLESLLQCSTWDAANTGSEQQSAINMEDIDINLVPKDLVSRIIKYQAFKSLFGLVTIITIVLAIYHVEDDIIVEDMKFHHSAISIFLAASDFFHLHEVRPVDTILEYSTIAGYFYSVPLDATSLIAAIAVSAAYNSFLKTPNLSNQRLYYRVPVSTAKYHKGDPSLIHLLTADTCIISSQKRLNHNVTSAQLNSIFVNLFVALLGKLYSIFEASEMPSFKTLIPVIVSFYYNMLCNNDSISNHQDTMDKVVHGVITGTLSISANAAEIPITTTQTLIKILAIKAQRYHLLRTNQNLFCPITRTLADIFHHWDLSSSSSNYLKNISEELYNILCNHSIYDLSLAIGLLFSQITHLLMSSNEKPSKVHSSLAAAALLRSGEDRLAAQVMRSCGFEVLPDTVTVRKRIIQCTASSPVAQIAKNLLNTKANDH